MAQSAEHLADLLLVDRCLGGEDRAAAELFRAYQGRVHATLYRVLGGNRDMDDLLQETFVQVFRSLGGFRGEARLGTWIDRIAVRVAYRHLSRKKSAALTVEMVEPWPSAWGEPPRAGGAPDERALAREGVRRFYAVLSELSPASRIAFVLHEVEGRKVAEVAECVGASVTATKLRIWRARRALRRKAEADPVLGEFLSDVDFVGDDR